jgi:hypothetical protein
LGRLFFWERKTELQLAATPAPVYTLQVGVVLKLLKIIENIEHH